MAYTRIELRQVYDRTSGYCHVCGEKLSFTNYGRPGEKGAWHVDHSKPRAKGGTDHANNLYAACINCNMEKATFTTKTARRWHGRPRAPLSRGKREKARRANAVACGVIGGIVGSLFGPLGTTIGAGIGARIGHDIKPD